MNRIVFDENKKTWKNDGVPTTVDPNMSCGTAILKVWDMYPDDISQVNDNNDIQFTNAEIRVLAIRVAQNLMKLGFRCGDVVQIIARNHHYLGPFFFGAVFIGAPINALDVQFSIEDIVHMLNMARPKLVLCDLDMIPTMKAAFELINFEVLHVYTFDGAESTFSRNIDELFVETYCENEFIVNDLEIIEHPIGIVCTSGTTKLSKGVCVSHQSTLETFWTGDSSIKSPIQETIMSFSSLYWFSGWALFLRSTLRSMKRIMTTEPFSSDFFLRIVEKYKVSYFISSPAAMGAILHNPNLPKTDLRSINTYYCAGSPVPDDRCLRMNENLPNGTVMIGYGMTETCGRISIATVSIHSNSVGQLFPGLEVKIINEDGDNLGIGEEGQICILPNLPFMGYYRDVQSTKQSVDECGWLCSGDVGYFDKFGTLFFVGRLNDRLEYWNHYIWPTEIESIILKHPGVSNVCVVGVPVAVAGDLPAAVIVKNNLVECSESDIINWIQEKLCDAEQLRGGVYFIENIPETPSGKILRRKVQEMVVQKYKESKL